ncbi:MAG: hypothetical protein HQM04_15355 [Magnetococcales bacterium]|nr:hypothetical protein [Magnetococcales bacterium]MBF0116403.1 hypothetical protein [Magnetococcales bacterium]
MTNTPHPNDMTGDQRLTEAGQILATALRRLKNKKKQEKFPLDNSPNQWLHGRKTTRNGEPKP